MTAQDVHSALGHFDALPDTAAAHAAVEFICAHERDYLVNHSVRSYLYGRLLGERNGLQPGRDYDPEIHFLATVLHDIGLTDEANGSQRFELDGADRAATFMREHGFSDRDVETVWDAVALHTSGQLAARKGTVVGLTQMGIAADIFGLGAEQLDDEIVETTHKFLPRLGCARELMTAALQQVTANPAKFVPFTFTHSSVEYLAPGAPVPGLTEILGASRWDD
ncbi:HD domain-containing protein [Pseudonocardia sp. N23]|uniref:HD domain-containing protein n=1 Tax=Pseudonocardia sp. N23 TaxID=1987376 RepID=UPI000BFD37A1|nr:HD domain-containing protein [Pseudonocardia sp. N23]GAY07393.1 hypothetical protein TOK_2618 [Pseudonocardia sp. N23]